MLPSSSTGGSIGNDHRLQSFLQAGLQADADCELARLMEAATPLITSSLKRLWHRSDPVDLEDSISEARTQLALRLQRLRECGSHRAASSGNGLTAISDFSAYVVTLARMAAAQLNRRRHPARAMLLNRLRYLLEGRTSQQGFALWNGPTGETWTGFAVWRDQQSFHAQSGERLGRLLGDARGVAFDLFGASGAESTLSALPLVELVGKLFSWLGEPLRLRDLTEAIADWQGIRAGRGEALSIADDGEPLSALLPSREPSPHDELRWKEYLRWLLQEASRLTLRQRSAFLLHSSCLREMEMLGLTGVRHAATLLEISPEQMIVHWAKLPLEDRHIGTILGVATQQVINLRKVARGILGRAWQRFLEEN